MNYPVKRNTVKYSVLCAVWLLMSQAAWADAYPVAGLQPDRRPVGAPVIHAASGGDEMGPRLLHGIKPPIPESIQRWAKDQGGWFNPFFYPGMTGRYDLRGWHENLRSGS